MYGVGRVYGYVFIVVLVVVFLVVGGIYWLVQLLFCENIFFGVFFVENSSKVCN